MVPIPVYPFIVPWLRPCHNYAPLIWLSGIVCLWLTRYTHQLAQRWGGRYYLVSAIIRPLGVFLIVIGWMALFAGEEQEDVYTPHRLSAWGPVLGLENGRPTPLFWLNLLWIAGVLVSLGFGLWAIAVLGLRRSFFYRRLDDPLITGGPYGIVRHPQFLSAIGVTFFTVQFYITTSWLEYAKVSYAEWRLGWDEIGMANWLLFTVALWLLAILEDRELAAHFGPEYALYAHRVARLFPN